MNTPLYRRLAGDDFDDRGDDINSFRFWTVAFRNAGYDYATLPSDWRGLTFPKKEQDKKSSISLNEGITITDRASFESYQWVDPNKGRYELVEKAAKELLPDGMKFIAWGPGGVLENVIGLCGYENLCFMLLDDPKLVEDIFEAVGSRLEQYYRIISPMECIGASISNDDWGFKTQTMLAPADMRKYVFPWHKRIVKAIHDGGKPAILHSCGKFDEIFDDVVDDMGYDGRHSYEDTIIPVEQAYETYGRRIAILGGIDVDFICRSSPEAVYRRSKAMLERTSDRGGYALGSGNSIPEYVPQDNYLAMIRAATEVG